MHVEDHDVGPHVLRLAPEVRRGGGVVAARQVWHGHARLSPPPVRFAVMDVGIGLPSTLPGAGREQMLEWARRAEARGFSTLGTLDRIVYPGQDPLIALAAAAGVTERIRLMTAILLAPTRANGAVLAKQAATLDVLSGGRLALGVAVGRREDDFAAVGVDFAHAPGSSTRCSSSWPHLGRRGRRSARRRPTAVPC